VHLFIFEFRIVYFCCLSSVMLMLQSRLLISFIAFYDTGHGVSTLYALHLGHVI